MSDTDFRNTSTQESAQQQRRVMLADPESHRLFVHRCGGKRPRKTATMLTEHQVIDVRHRRREGETVKSLAREFDVSISTVGQIVSRRSWKDV